MSGGAPDPQFEDWKNRAAAVDILSAANAQRAKLKRVGQEHVGPCPRCGGKDRFGVHPKKGVFVCRGKGGGDVIAMVMHCAQVDFLGACEILTGEAPPRGKSKPLSDEEKQRRELQDAEREAEQSQRREEAERKREMSAEESARIWAREVVAIDGTPAEAYLVKRGIPRPPAGWPRECIGFHRGLDYRLPPFGRFPALIGRIQDIAGDTVALQAVFLTPEGTKIDRDPAKLTYGPMMGGAIRIGGVGPVINACEGLETGLGICWLLGWSEPVWPTLGTSGLAGLEPPLECERIRAWLDGDLPIKKQDGEFVPTKAGPGQVAGRALAERIKPIGIHYSSNEPPPDSDWLDVWNSVRQLQEAK